MVDRKEDPRVPMRVSSSSQEPDSAVPVIAYILKIVRLIGFSHCLERTSSLRPWSQFGAQLVICRFTYDLDVTTAAFCDMGPSEFSLP